MEEIGVRTGLIYGAYHYGDQLGAKLGHVPVIIPLAWFMMIYPSWMVARALIRGIKIHSIPGLTAQALVAAMVMTAWDVVMDPSMAAAGNWIWENGGAYFGVPRHNYLGWLLTTFLVYWIVGWLWRDTKHTTSVTKAFQALPVIVYSFFAVRYVTAGGLPALQLIALFSMGMPALVALLQVCMNKNDTTVAHQATIQPGGPGGRGEAMVQTQRVAILTPLAVGAIAVLCTIFIHALAVVATVNFVRREKRLGREGAGVFTNLAIVASAMSFALVAHLIEIALWAVLFVICGEFQEFGTAYYFSAVNYTTLGYGDLIMSPAWKLLGPLEAADGTLMFGVSTAIIFALIVRLVQAQFEDLRT